MSGTIWPGLDREKKVGWELKRLPFQINMVVLLKGDYTQHREGTMTTKYQRESWKNRDCNKTGN